MTIEVSTNVNPIVNLQVSTTDPQNPTVDVDVPGAVVVGVDTTVLLGPKGDPGFSPIANVSKSGTTATITITDQVGTTTASVSDGAKGDTGDSGVRISETEPTDPVVNVWINPNGTETQYVEDVQVNGSTVVTDKVASITMPTKVSDLTNDSNFQTGSQVTTAITSKTQPIESTITTMQTSMTSLGSTVTTMQTTMSSYGDVVTHNANEFYASNNPSNYQSGSQVTTAITSETNPIKSTVTTMQTTMSNYGDVVTHDADEFYLATNPNNYQTSTQVTSAVTSYHDSTKYDASNPNGYTSNTGTITGITMNGSSKGTSGVVDLGIVITSHQDITGKENTSNKVTTLTSSSTNTQYPSAKCVYDELETKQASGNYARTDSANTFSGAQRIETNTTNGLVIKSTTSGGYLVVSRGSSDPINMAIKCGANGGTFGTTTNHEFYFRTNDANRLKITNDGDVLLVKEVPADSNNKQIASTEWVNDRLDSVVGNIEATLQAIRGV